MNHMYIIMYLASCIIIINISIRISSIAVRFEVPMVVNTKVTVIWYVASYSSVNSCRSLEETATFFSNVTVEESQIP